MDQIDERKILWANVAALMNLRYGEENLSRLAREAKIGPASMTRIKEQQTSVGTEAMGKIAVALKVQAWQLLFPGLDVARLDQRKAEEKPVAPPKPAGPSFYGQQLSELFDELPDDKITRVRAYQACTQILLEALQPREPMPSETHARAVTAGKQRA